MIAASIYLMRPMYELAGPPASPKLSTYKRTSCCPSVSAERVVSDRFSSEVRRMTWISFDLHRRLQLG